MFEGLGERAPLVVSNVENRDNSQPKKISKLLLIMPKIITIVVVTLRVVSMLL